MTVLSVTLLAILCVYLWVAFLSAETASSPKGFFIVETSRRARWSLVFGGITLGTGFAVQSQLGAQIGLLAFLGPLGALCGFVALSRIENILHTPEDEERDNFARYFEGRTFERPIFSILGFTKVITFLLLISFELYVSAQYLGALFGVTEQVSSVLLFSVVLGLLAGAYTALGGMSAATATDKIQGISVIVLLLLLAVIGTKSLLSDGVQATFGFFGSSTLGNVSDYLIYALSVFTAAFATQFYNVINLISTRTRKSSENSKSFKKSGRAQILIIVSIIAIGATFSLGNYGSIENYIASLAAGNSLQSLLFSIVILVGMTSIVFTTVDAAIVAITQLVGDMFGLSSDEDRPRTWPRLTSALLAFIAIPISLVLISFEFDLVQILLLIVLPVGGLALFLAADLLRTLSGVAATRRWDNFTLAWVFALFALALHDAMAKEGAWITSAILLSVIPAIARLYFPARWCKSVES